MNIGDGDSSTRIFSVSDLIGRSDWKVFRVRTTSGSRYHVALRTGGGRRTGILCGTQSDGTRLEVHNDSPQVGEGFSIFDTEAESWVGQRLLFGETQTSLVVNVEPETSSEIIASVTGVHVSRASDGRTSPSPPPPRPAKAPEPPFPENHIREVEFAAHLIRRAYQKSDLVEELSKRPEHMERMKLALTECALILHAFGTKLSKKE